MQRAIAARGRLCQAAALAFVLWPSSAVCQNNASDQLPPVYQAQTPGGVVVTERCPSVTASATDGYRCGALAEKASDVITQLSVLLGPFPRRSLDVTLVLRLGSIATTADRNPRAAGDSRLASVFLYLPDLLPREVARQWFERGESRSRIEDRGLAEGLPQYLAWRYLSEASPEAARALVAQAMRDSVTGNWQTGPGPVVFGNLPAQRQRGLLLLRTLETVIDRERLDRAMGELVRRYSQRSFSLEDFRKVCEEIAGRDLEWFFRYFFKQGGIPEIELKRLPSESPGVVAGEITVRGMPPEGSVRVEMIIRTAQGTVEHSVATRGPVTPFSMNVPGPALDITLDPDQRILRWTEAARRSQAVSKILAVVPSPLASTDLRQAIGLYRHALAADPGDAALRAQDLRERLGELESAIGDWPDAFADFDAAINGHSIAPFETYLTRGKAYLYHGRAALHEHRLQDALEDARAGLALPLPVLLTRLPRDPVERGPSATLQQLLIDLQESASP